MSTHATPPPIFRHDGAAHSHYKRISPARLGLAASLTELWQYRELLFFLTWRDVRVLYKQTVLGGLWAILQPLLTMVVFTIFFGRLAEMPSDGAPYPLFSFTALLPWTFFANSLSQSTSSLVSSQNLLKKVYFPRLAIPISAVLSKLVDFLLAFIVLVGLMLYFGYPPTARVVWLLPLVLLAMTAALGAGLWLSAMNVQFRDVRHAVPFLIQIWLFATPVIYPSSLLDSKWLFLYFLNPMAGVVEGFRWALLGTNGNLQLIGISSFVAISLLVGGLRFFRRMESSFADVV